MQCSKCKKTFTRADNLKKHKCRLVLDQETGRLSDSNEASSNDVTTEQLTNKALVNIFPRKTSPLDSPPIRKKCLKFSKENSPNCAKNFRHQSLNNKCSNLYEDIEEYENEQSMKADPEIRAFMQKYWTSI